MIAVHHKWQLVSPIQAVVAAVVVAAVQWVPLRGVLEVFLQEECLNSNQQATEVNWEQEVLKDQL